MTIKKLTNSAILIFICIFINFLFFSGVSGGVYAAAETGESESGIMKELGGVQLDGKPFDSADYPADEEGTPRVLLLNEVGYSFLASNTAAYALYVYIYDPLALDVKEDMRNTIEMKVGDAERYDKFALKLLDMSGDKLFIKYQVRFTESKKAEVLGHLDSAARVYDVSSIELYTTGANATDYALNYTQIFTFKGYAKGFGQNEESTLTGSLEYTVEGGHDLIPLSVNHTSWRPEGTNGNSEYTQDVIHSVYFAIPKEYDEKYDYLNSVHARWIEARTNPIYITGNQTVLDELVYLEMRNLQYASLMQQGLPDKFDYSGMSWYLLADDISGSIYKHSYEYYFGNDYWYKVNNEGIPDHGISPAPQIRNRLNTLYLMHYTDGAGVVTSEEVKQIIADGTANLGPFNDSKVAGKYASALFESYDSVFTDKTIYLDDKYTLNSEQIKRNFWEEWLFGGSHIENKQDYTVMEAIQQILPSDIIGETKEIAKNLYISERDVRAFQDFFIANNKDNYIYLLRFATSEYYRVSTSECQDIGGGISKAKSTGYLAQANCYLDFDVIDLDYVKGDEHYILAVSMSPVDIFTELTPPPGAVSDFWKYGALTIAGLSVFYFIYRALAGHLKNQGVNTW